jgi:type III secretion protein V
MKSTPLPLAGRLGRIGWFDAALAAVVVAVVTLMIVPLPTPLLDVLLSTNLAISISILLITLYVPDALHIASFPTLLLITTLLRLGLNVASTRLILLQANAGEVIRSFGQFVVGSNYIVGGVVFLVLTLIQYLVIAKGSERVAEVGARFTLDAMPGKQMGIDAELRAGAINGQEAQRRRRTLGREGQFYGAMDGAMKFVKGDVVASILIAFVNILGGLAIGMGQKGMDAVDALKRYGLLTIGDGLVTQIPALILATSAGVLVTRVASEEPNTSLGAELGAQLLGAPQALFVASTFVMALSLVPGLPFAPLFVIGLFLFFASRARARHLGHHTEAQPLSQILRRGKEADELHFVPLTVPWSVQVALDLERYIDDGKRVPSGQVGIRSAANQLREQLFLELGVPLPPCQVVADPALAPHCLRLVLHEVPGGAIQLANVPPSLGFPRFLAETVLPTLRGRASDFLGMSETQMLLDELERVAPQSVRQVIPKPVTLAVLSEILRRLVDEGLSIRDLKSILEALSQAASVEKDPLQLTEQVRAQMRRALTHQLTAGKARLPVVMLDPSLEEVIRESVARTTAGAFLALAPDASRDIIAAIRRAMEQARTKGGESAVLLAAPDTRRFIRRLVETDLPQLKVVSPAELLPEIALETLATATVTNL